MKTANLVPSWGICIHVKRSGFGDGNKEPLRLFFQADVVFDTPLNRVLTFGWVLAPPRTGSPPRGAGNLGSSFNPFWTVKAGDSATTSEKLGALPRIRLW